MSYVAYKHDIEPEFLREDVVFRIPKGAVFPLAISAGGGAFFLFLVLVCLYETISGDWSRTWLFPWVPCVGAVVTAIYASVSMVLRSGGMIAKVNSRGILVQLPGRPDRFCAWRDMTMRKGRLCDAAGNALWNEFLQSEDPDAPAVRAIIRTKLRALKRLARPRPKAAARPILLWLLGSISLAAIAGMILFPTALRSLVAAAIDPFASPLTRALAICGIVVFTCSCVVPIFIWVAAASDSEGQRRWKPDRFPELTEFLALRMGRLEAVEMEPGVWYRYVSPEGLRRNSGIPEPAWTLVVGGLALLAAGIWLGITQDCWLGVTLGLFASIILGSSLALDRVGRQLLRPLNERVRRLPDDAYELSAGEETVRCRLFAPLKRQRVPAAQFGALYLVLEDEEGRKHRIDPRYLVPEDSARVRSCPR